MPQLSLTDLVDIVSTAGTPKATKVSQVKNRGDYAPAFDFYKALREGLSAAHQPGGSKAALQALPGKLADYKKVANYTDAIGGYVKWWGQKSITAFDPVRKLYSKHGVDVSVNPELGLETQDGRYLVKLYLKAEPLTKFKADLITVLMETALRTDCKQEEVMAILDVRRGKLFTLGAKVAPIKAMVDAELAYVANLWDSL